MAASRTSAILLRRIEFGDYDLIVTLFTRAEGKTSAIAKSAKKSVKRFPGVLEPFSHLNVVLSRGRRKGLPVLQEAWLENPFFNIRENIVKTAYASYWAELSYLWMAEGEPLAPLYQLLLYVLGELDRGKTSVELLSILFQMRFLSLAGFCPNFEHCQACKIGLDRIRHKTVVSDPSQGGIVCPTCGLSGNERMRLSKGTLKLLMWTNGGDLERASRIRFAPETIDEGLNFLEAFVPYHLAKRPKSLTILRDIRQALGGRVR